MGINVITDEPAIVVLQLIGHALAAMARVLVRFKSGVIQMMDGVALLSVAVAQARRQPLHIVTVSFQPEITEHMIERAVLHYQHDDLVDLLQVV
jgi:hypothetical protein